jgi:hypothetical protein
MPKFTAEVKSGYFELEGVVYSSHLINECLVHVMFCGHEFNIPADLFIDRSIIKIGQHIKLIYDEFGLNVVKSKKKSEHPDTAKIKKIIEGIECPSL